jgi:O-methyltransferase domain
LPTRAPHYFKLISIKLSENKKVAQPTHAKLLLIEGILPEDSTSGWIEMLDIFMLALITGRERTRREFETLLNSSGFRLDKVIDVGLSTSIVEASVI